MLATLALLLGGGAVSAQAAPTSPAPSPTPTSAGAPGCTPTFQVLPTVPGPWPGESAVYGLSLKDQIAVGMSEGLPVYWVGSVLHRVPLPKGYVEGSVTAVNRFGLMVGFVSKKRYEQGRAFRYWAGSKAVELYPRSITNATDVNDAGLAVGSAPESDAVFVFGPGTRTRRMYSLPAGYTLKGDGIQINNSGFVLASGYDETTGGQGVDAFTWSPTSSSPQPVLPRHYLAAPGTESNDTVYGSTQPVALDNRNHMVGSGTGVYRPEGPASWSSLEATATTPYLPPINEAGGLAAILVALGDRSGIAAGTALIQGDLRGGTLPDAGPETAVVWDGSGNIVPLFRGGGSQALAAQDDGRVAGRGGDTGHWVPVLWTCALGR